MLDKTIPYHVLDYGPFNNEYEQAIPVLKQVLRPSCSPHIQTEDQQHA